MIRYSFRYTAALSVAFFVVAALCPPQSAHARTDAATAAPARWKIETDSATVWLFGTFHLLPPDLHWRSDAVNAALESADTLWLEADVTSEESQAEMAGLIAEHGMNPAGVTLSSMLDGETNAVLNIVTTRMGASAAALQPMRPWLASLMLAVHTLHALGFDPSAGADAVLDAEARAAGMRIRYFETAAEQLGFFANVPLRTQIEWLAQTLREMDELPEQVDEMTHAWVTGDVDTLDTLFNDAMRDDNPELYEILMVNRNRAWVPTIVDMLQEGGRHFVAVGAAHLPGDDGLVALLQEAGIEASR
jgi:uncharacterized protein